MIVSAFGIPILERTSQVVRNPATQKDTLKLMFQFANQSANHPFIQAVAKKVAQTDDPIKAAFNYCYRSFIYWPDEENNQVVKTAMSVLDTRTANCVNYCGFLSALFLNMGVNHVWRQAAIDQNGNFEHIYAVTESGIVLDCVLGQNPDGEQSVAERPNKNGMYNREADLGPTRDYWVLYNKQSKTG